MDKKLGSKLHAVAIAWLACIASVLVTVCSVPKAHAGFTETVLTDQLNSPTSMALAPDGRIFVAQQAGALRVIAANGSLLSTPFVTVNTVADDEEGLLGVAFDPQFASNGFVYVSYTVNQTTPTARRFNRISRFTANGNVATAGSEQMLFELDDNGAHYHLGGALHFGVDGKLYTSTGDNANGTLSQNMSSTFGKILRLNKDGSIPTDNPFYSTASGKYRAIWAKGFRNAFTFSFQPGTGRLFINDVGGSLFEEVNEGVAGGDYGWPNVEGPDNNPPRIGPLHSYSHANGCAITGGSFYNPATVSFPNSFVGKYFYAEYCVNEIRWIDPANPVAFTSFRPTLAAGPVDVRTGADGNLYYLARGNSDSGGGPAVPGGRVVRIGYTSAETPTISVQPADRAVSVGQGASFSVVASSATALTYQWQKNGADVPNATSASLTTAPTVLADSGTRYRVVVSNSVGNIVSRDALLTVTSNQPPVPVISTPSAGSTYTGNSVINFSGSASDPESGPLPASSLTWRIDFHHGTHVHPAYPSTSGIAGGAYTAQSDGHVDTNVYFRIYLTAIDADGASATVTRDVMPVIRAMRFRSDPPGAMMTLDAQPQATPLDVDGVVGIARTIGIVSPQTIAGQRYVFASWSDGGGNPHGIVTPTTDTTYTARLVLEQIFASGFE
jgi:glucose/arabinose dehydrogenase